MSSEEVGLGTRVVAASLSRWQQVGKGTKGRSVIESSRAMLGLGKNIKPWAVLMGLRLYSHL